MSTVSSGASASTASSSSKTYSLFNLSSQAALVKLDRSNYIVWEANVLPMIIDQVGLTWEDASSALMAYETKLEHQNQFSAMTIPPVANVAQSSDLESPKNASSDKTPWRFLNRRAPPSSNECIVPFIIQSTDASSPHPAPRVINATDPTASSNSSPARTPMVNSSQNPLHSDSRDSVRHSRATQSNVNIDLGRDTSQSSEHSEFGPTCEQNDTSQLSDQAQQPLNQHIMMTRSRAGIYKPKTPYIGAVSSPSGSCVQNPQDLEPKSVQNP
ncbi:uncharacterized protein G2W53_022730 [Senna tora]|uniref:Retrotransposon Copia-like N-terminal domain-containing protein n=1 Tax=Senna tora TaxID=362788 RepID=A0A834WME0_9FABA|nr:uncharacterized protein G2W53_022730 [Senna tora]